MKSNRFVCSFCRAENPPKLYFLPCLNVFCNKCVASQIKSAADHRSKLKTEKVFVKGSEFETYYKNTGITSAKYGEKSHYSLARDDESYETIEVELTSSVSRNTNEEGYEIPTGHDLYQNSSISNQVSNVVQLHLNEECYYEEIESKGGKKTNPSKVDCEVFEEIHAKQSENLTKSNLNLLPMPSFCRKYATFPMLRNSQPCCQNRDISLLLKPQLKKSEVAEGSETPKCPISDETPSNGDNVIVPFKCPFCLDLHWVSEQGELFMQFPAFPRNSVSIPSKKMTEVVEFLSSLPSDCCSKLCNNPSKSKYCCSCGRTLCESCADRHHSKHHAYESASLNTRYKSLVECYNVSNERRKRSCADEIERLQSGIGKLNDTKAKTIEMLCKQKKLLIMEVDRIFKDKVKALERNVGLETTHLEASLDQIDSQVTKLNRFLDFSEAFLDDEYSSPNKLDILLSLVSSYPALEQFEMPDPPEPVDICMEQHEIEAGELSRMLGEIFFKRKSPDALSSESAKVAGNSHVLESGTFHCEASVNQGKATSKPETSKSSKGRAKRPNWIFKRANFLPKKEDGQTQSGKEDGPGSVSAPSASFNLQLTSDGEECRLSDFSSAKGRHIVAVDVNNQCLKLLNLGNDSLKVIPLEERFSAPLKVAILETSEESLVIIAQQGSNCLKLYNKDGQELLRIGENYLLSVSSIATNSLGQIFASDTVHMKVFAYDCHGNALFSFPRGARHGKLKSPQYFVPLDIRTNPCNDDLVVLDGTRMSFLVFDRVGTCLFHLPVVDSLSSAIISSQQVGNGESGRDESRTTEPQPSSTCKDHGDEYPISSITCNRNYSGIIFDEEGCIYQRSSLGDKLVVHGCNGKFKNEIPIRIPDFDSCHLISVMDCHVERAGSKEDADGSAPEKSIVLSSQSSTISIYKLEVSASTAGESMPDPNPTPAEKEVGDLSFKVIESRYADMTGRKRDADQNLCPLVKENVKSTPENIYTTIGEKSQAAEPQSKSHHRFSRSVKKIFKSNASSKALSTDGVEQQD